MLQHKKSLVATALALCALGAFGMWVPQQGVPHKFVAGEVAVADQVNQNFAYVDAVLDTIDSELDSIDEEMDRPGTQVGPGLYEVHARVLWDAGWMQDAGTGFPGAVYTEDPTPLTYGSGRSTFLKPLMGYGIPDPAPGATRKVRLYVNYGHQWMCEGIPTVTVGDVEFELPMISGHAADMATNWSGFRDLSEYQHLGHCPIYMHLKNFVWSGSHCNPTAGAWRGVVYRIEAHFYDEYL